jgi:hypothetical protein
MSTLPTPATASLMPASISTAEYHAMQAAIMTEDELLKLVTVHAGRYGWLVYHTHDSRRSQAGYPDLHLVHVGRKLTLFRELKSMKGSARPEQKVWLAALKSVGSDAGIWRPIDWFDGTISEQLSPTTPIS